MIKTSLRSAGPAAAELNRRHSKKAPPRCAPALYRRVGPARRWQQADGQLMGPRDGFPRQSAPGSFHEMKFHPAGGQKC